MSAKEQQLKAFQDFQKNFFMSPMRFQNYTSFDIRKHGFMLLNNIAKGFPGLIDIIINLKGFGWEAFTSFELIRALQAKLVNPYNGYKVPSYIFFKTLKAEKQAAVMTKQGLEFSMEIKREICERLMMDSKTYEYLKYSELVQRCGRQLVGDIKNTEQLKKKKK